MRNETPGRHGRAMDARDPKALAVGRQHAPHVLTFAGREYRPTDAELEQLAAALEMRAHRPASGIYRMLDDQTFAPLAVRIREALEPATSPIDLQRHEAAAALLASATIESAELDRFRVDCMAENELNVTEGVTELFGFRIGQWFHDNGEPLSAASTSRPAKTCGPSG